MVWILLLALGCHTPTDKRATESGDAGCAAGLDMNDDGVCDHDVADWSRGATIAEGENRANIYDLDEDDLLAARTAGLKHAFYWPVPTTRMLLPLDALRTVFTDPDAEVVRQVLETATGFRDEAGMYDRMGLSAFPETQGDVGSAYWAPPPPGQGPGDPMGATWLDTDEGLGLTFSCAACHIDTLFGRPVMGLQNKRPRPNALFHVARTALAAVDGETFQQLTDATDGERAMYERTVVALRAVGTREPETLGLDTSLAQWRAASPGAMRTPKHRSTRSSKTTPERCCWTT